MNFLWDSNYNPWLLKVLRPMLFMFSKSFFMFFLILFLTSISTYKPEANLKVLFARKIFRSALKVEFVRFFIEKSYKQHQFKIFQTSQTELKKKREKLILKRTALNRYLHMISNKFWTLLYKKIYTFILICVQIQFKGYSRQLGILLRNRLSNMRLNLQIR